MSECATCRASLGDGMVVCHDCGAQLVAWLAAVPGLAAELEVTTTRQDRMSTGWTGGGKSSERPLPWNDRSSRAARELTDVVVGWAGRVCEGPFPGLRAAVTALEAQRGVLPAHSDAGELYGDLRRVVRRATAVIDRPPDRLFAGQCGTTVIEAGQVAHCARDLYALPGEETVTCRDCSAEHDVGARREWMLTELNGQAADAGLMASILAQLGFKIHSSTIRRYGAEGLLTVVSRDAKGTPRYRIGEVLDVFVARKSRKKGKKIA